MAVDPDRPLLFLTFANACARTLEHLRNLAEESRPLRRTLKAAPYAHTYTVEHKDHAQLDDILDYFETTGNGDSGCLKQDGSIVAATCQFCAIKIALWVFGTTVYSKKCSLSRIMMKIA